jgi:hypothetical protein
MKQFIKIKTVFFDPEEVLYAWQETDERGACTKIVIRGDNTIAPSSGADYSYKIRMPLSEVLEEMKKQTSVPSPSSEFEVIP